MKLTYAKRLCRALRLRGAGKPDAGGVQSAYDRKIVVTSSSNDWLFDHYLADLWSVSDYHPFGMAVEERSWAAEEYRFGSLDELRKHLALFLLAYNFGKRLKALKGQTPYERNCNEFDQTPNSFKCNPRHYTAGPCTYLNPEDSQ